VTSFISFVFVLVISSQAYSDEIIENFYSTRALGMGNAYSAVVDDSTALMYNPAGLNKIRNLHFTVLGLNVGTDDLTIQSEVSNITGNNYATIIQNYYGKQLWAAFNDLLTVSGQDFALGAYSAAVISFNLHNPAYPTIPLLVYEDLAATAGFSIGLFPNDALKLGISGKRITRLGGQTTLTAQTLATLSNTQITNLINNYGTGYGLDTGLILELPAQTHPAFSFVWHDVGQTAFSLQSGTTPLVPIDNNFVAGFSMRLDGPAFSIKPAFDFTHINLYSEDLGKRIHAGVEFTFTILSLRGGVNEGYYTAGAGVKLKAFEFDAATYGEEIGVFPGQQEDRRYMASVAVDLEWENSFSMNGKSSGPVRRAYERR
jgi:hypothetical protein